MTKSRTLSPFALLALAALVNSPAPVSARPAPKHTAHSHAKAHRTQTAKAHPKYVRGIGTHGTATTGAAVGTSTNIVPAGGTNADPLGGGTTSTGTATNGSGVSNK